MGPLAVVGRIVQWAGRGRGCGPGSLRDRIGDVRVDCDPCILLRCDRAAADLRAGEPLRRNGALLDSGQARALRAHRCREEVLGGTDTRPLQHDARAAQPVHPSLDETVHDVQLRAHSFEAAQVHVEYFTPKAEPARTGGFIVELARSGREFFIPAGQSILGVLLDEGIDVDYSCELGICGACEQRVLAGEPEHRDSVLTDEEQAGNKRVMICCAGCKSERLVLDL